jgi:hypothetical protein
VLFLQHLFALEKGSELILVDQIVEENGVLHVGFGFVQVVGFQIEEKAVGRAERLAVEKAVGERQVQRFRG